MKFGVVVFPGSNCDADAYFALQDDLGQKVEYIWHGDTDLGKVDAVILPGGFSYGDYLRTGALARFAPVMGAVAQFAARGGPVLGICNGFQILLEAGLLPGAMLRNACLQFRCEWVHVRVESTATAFSRRCHRGQVLRLPIAHGEGNYYAGPEARRELEENGRVVLRYCDPDGRESAAANPNGSLAHIAGISNARGNVVGMMPHPERCCSRLLGGTDGRSILLSAVGFS
ncbi:MAG TPA: phosphoribosylformylglycinamidine synthase I [Clostridiales bacterium UBA8153]|nr:phosphoribosylformylglycinamidine synthase I [Clostridiales bacterium UBA8153]